MSVPNTFASATSAIPLANLDADFAYYDAAFQIAAGAMEVNYIFRLEDPTDVTKKAEFVMSGITTGTTRQYTMPNVTGALASLGNISQTFTGSTSIIPTTNGSAITIGGIPSTGTITLGRSTASQTIDIAVGATTAASTKTVNIGTTGVSTSTTNINYGSSVTGALVTQTWNAGANSMRLDSSGNLGVGTTSPGAKLEVAGASPTIKITANNATPASLQLTQSGVGNWLKYFRVSDSAFVEQFGGSDLLVLSTTGNLGLGVTPSAWGSGYKTIDFSFGSFSSDNTSVGQAIVSTNLYNTGTAASPAWKFKSNGYPVAYIQNASTAGHQWFVGAANSSGSGAVATLTQAMTLDASGNLGIGTTSPATKLHISTDGTYDPFRLQSTASGFERSWTLGPNVGANGVFAIRDSTIGTNRLIINTYGNIGIGDLNAWAQYRRVLQIGGLNSAVLALNGTSASSEIFLNSYANSSFANIYAATGFAGLFDFNSSSAGGFAWKLAPSGTAGNTITFTQAMTLDASGRLLIANTSSTGTNTKLSVGSGLASANAVIVSNTANGAYPALQVSNWTGSATTNGPYMSFDNSGQGAWTVGSGNGVNTFDICQTWGTPLVRVDASGNVIVGNIATANGKFMVYDANASVRATSSTGPSIRMYAGGVAILETSTNDDLIVRTNAVEVARFTTGSNLLVGTTAAYGGPGRINVGFNQSTNFGITLRNTNAAATGVFVSFENSGGTGNGSISQTNSTTVAYNTSSDRRLKTAITPAVDAGSDIDAIQVVSHGWVSNDDHVKYGVIAQDLVSVAPQAVRRGDDGAEVTETWGVDYSKLVPMLVKELQSLRARVAQLESK